VQRRVSQGKAACALLLAAMSCGCALRTELANSGREAALSDPPLRHVEPDPQPTAAIEVLFTGNQHGRPEASCERPLCRRLVAAIDGAQRSVDFAIYGLRDQNAVIDALVEAQVRGVRVRGVVDTEGAACDDFEYQHTGVLIQRLGSGSVRCDSGPGHGAIMHDKFFVFDGEAVWTGSTNISDTELGGEYYADAALLLSSRELAQVYTRELEEMYAGQFHKHKVDDTLHVLAPLPDGTQLESYFSPSDRAIDNAVLPLIAGAQRSLDVAMYFFTEQRIAAELQRAHARGVKLRMVLDASGALNAYSKHTQLCAAGVPVKIESWGGKSHSKWAVADAEDPERATVLVGSLNWTRAADEENDENTLLIRQNAAVAAAFAREFARQWADLPDAQICARVQAEGPRSAGSCSDGLDNDHDGHADLADEACSCSDGLDNDGDGHIDAADFECQPT